MDLTSIDSKFTVTEPSEIWESLYEDNRITTAKQNNYKYFFINYLPDIFGYIKNLKLRFIDGANEVSFAEDLSINLTTYDIDNKLKNKKYVLNDYSDYKVKTLKEFSVLESYTGNFEEYSNELLLNGLESELVNFPIGTSSSTNNEPTIIFSVIGRSLSDLYNRAGINLSIINLIYLSLYTDEDLKNHTTINYNGIFWLWLFIDMYLNLANKVDTPDGLIIENVTKPIIVGLNYESYLVKSHNGFDDIGNFKHSISNNKFWGFDYGETYNNRSCLINKTSTTLDNLLLGKFVSTTGAGREHKIYDYFVTNLDFIEHERHGVISGIYYSILFPIMIPTPIDISLGVTAVTGVMEPNVIEGDNTHINDSSLLYGNYNGNVSGFDIFFTLKLSSGVANGEIPTLENVKTVINNLYNSGTIGNVWPITILGQFIDTDSNDDFPLYMLECKGSYQMPVEVEWLTVDGTQWFDTGIKGNGNTDAFEIEFHQTTHNVQVRFVSDVTATGATSSNICQMYINGSNGLSYNEGGGWREVSSTYRNVWLHKYRYKVDYKNRQVIINGAIWTNTKYKNSTSSYNIGIFAKSGSSQRFKGKLYSFKMWRNNVLQRDMVPVRIGQMPALLDKLTNKIYRAGGGNTCILGPDKTDWEIYRGGIRFNGTDLQYIHTDVRPSGSNISFYIRFKINSWGDTQTYTRLFCAYYAETIQAFRLIKGADSSHLIITNGGLASGGSITVPFELGMTYKLFCDSTSGTYTIIDEDDEVITGTLPTPATPTNISYITFGDLQRKADWVLYDFKIWDGDTCICDIISVRNVNDTTDFAIKNNISSITYRNHGAGKLGIDRMHVAYSNTSKQWYEENIIPQAEYIYVDDFRNGNPDELVADDGYDTWDNWLNDYYLNDNVYDGNRYKYTGDTITLNNTEYYLWQKCDEFGNYHDNTSGKATYIITDTINYITLHNRSIEQNHNSTYTVTRLMSDQSVYTSDANNQYLIRAERGGDYSNEYLTIKILSNGKFRWNGYNSVISNNNYKAFYNKNGTNWVGFNESHMELNVNTDDKIYFKMSLFNGTNATCLFNFVDSTNASTCTYDVEGNIMSLIYGDKFRGKTSFDVNDYLHHFRSLFENNNKLINAKNLILPATTLTERCYEKMFKGCVNLRTAPKTLPATTLTNYCYTDMFNGCTSLINTPKLPATTLADDCYYSMFENCTNLTRVTSILPAKTCKSECYYRMFYGCTSMTIAPELPATNLSRCCYDTMFYGCTSLTSVTTKLPATTLIDYCYNSMFNGCTSLTTAPELPAKTLVSNCYQSMFSGCTNLNYVKAMFTTSLDTFYYTRDWLLNVASEGTFVMNAAADWMYDGYGQGKDGVPVGWTVQTATS